MGLFARSSEYGGRQTLEFNQNKHPFISEQQQWLKGKGRSKDAGLIHNGVCSALSLQWLEYYQNDLTKQFSLDLLKTSKIAQRIVETQIVLTSENMALHHTLPDLLISEESEKFKELKFPDEDKRCRNLLLEPGIKTISFQGTNSHSVTAISTKPDEKTTLFKLFDANAGEVTFIITEDVLKQENNPIEWLKLYLQSYKKSHGDAIIKNFQNTWQPLEVRDNYYSEWSELNQKKSSLADETTPLSQNTYSIHHQARKSSSADTPKCNLKCIIL